MSEIKTINIKGSEYATVNERLKYFRENYKGWSLTSRVIIDYPSTVVRLNEKDFKREAYIIMEATVADPDGKIMATGIACEKENFTNVNKTSYVENCETSAWGRALANLGIGIDGAVASADEVANAIANQK